MSIPSNYQDIPLSRLDSPREAHSSTKVKISKDKIVKTASDTKHLERLGKDAVQSMKLSERSPFIEVPAVLYNVESLLEKLQPGDIILSYFPESSDAVAGIIRTGQTVTKLYTKTSTKESHNLVHAGIYVGEGKLAEAVKDGVRINSIEGKRFKLDTNMTQGYLVLRLKDPAIAEEAGRIAQQVAVEEGPSLFKYAFDTALKSLFSDSKSTKTTIQHLLSDACYACSHILPTDRKDIKDFFCSYLVAWSCQVAQVSEAIKKINEELPEGGKIQIPNLSLVSDPKERKAIVKEWATRIAAEYQEELEQYLTLDFNPSNMTPQRFFGFALEHPDLLSQEMLIVAPREEMEMEELRKE